MRPISRNVFFLLFTLSGFSGLIYESIWTHYLKLFLGHAAYAQTLVLAIFMGGMAIGSWLCSRYSGRWRNLLKGYAVAEGVIGIGALLFHDVFAATIELSYSTILPQLGSPAAVTAYKWIVSSLLILPQSVLLGMTFPLMSAGMLRVFPDRPGRSVAMLYFTNSIGAVIGVLASGFVMIRLLGLPGTIRTAGIINVTLAAVVWLLTSKGTGTCGASPLGGHWKGTGSEGACPPNTTVSATLFLAASLVTGAASFIYEIGWIRMLSLVLGSSTHAFELMLAAFIFGLACGGLFIQRSIDRISRPVRFLAKVQVAMGMLALSTLLFYDSTFSVMQWLIVNLAKTDTGYTLFNLSSSAIAIAVMLPATFFAGMTLPLITLVLMKEGHGERSIGAVYAANTVGAIAGVFFAIHLGMPVLGLKGLITSGAALDIGLGVILFWSAAAQFTSRRIPAAVTAASVVAVAAVIAFIQLDLYKMGSGVYRNGILIPRQGFRHLYHQDGKTATVDVFLDGMGSMRINTNGKTDATIMTDPERPAGMDEATMTMLAAIPMALHPNATTAASIGLGSGLTSEILLENPSMKLVDSVEIERGMVEAARNFRPFVERVYTDPRSKIHVDDAKTFFSTYQRKYDIIISEPSNPWVSGVSGLFSDEFYRLIKNHINEDGLFVQWVQLYEIDTELVCSVLKAVSKNFADYVIYAPDDRDIMIIATKNGKVPRPDGGIFQKGAMAAALKKVQVQGVQDIELRKVADKKLMERLLASMPVRVNSDYFPVLDQNAARTRFLNASADEMLYFAQMPFPTAQLFWRQQGCAAKTAITPTGCFPKTEAAVTAMALRDFFVSGLFAPQYRDVPEEEKAHAVQVRKLFFSRDAAANEQEQLDSLFRTAENILPYLSPDELRDIWRTLEAGPAAGTLSPLEKQTVALFKSIGARDGAGMTAAAGALLQRETDLDPGIARYVVASAMVGDLMQGRKAEAQQLCSQQRALLFGPRPPDLLFRLLSAEAAM